jgi:hypothetical protein
VFSKPAAGIDLLLFDRVDDAKPGLMIRHSPGDQPHVPLHESWKRPRQTCPAEAV